MLLKYYYLANCLFSILFLIFSQVHNFEHGWRSGTVEAPFGGDATERILWWLLWWLPWSWCLDCRYSAVCTLGTEIVEGVHKRPAGFFLLAPQRANRWRPALVTCDHKVSLSTGQREDNFLRVVDFNLPQFYLSMKWIVRSIRSHSPPSERRPEVRGAYGATESSSSPSLFAATFDLGTPSSHSQGNP